MSRIPEKIYLWPEISEDDQETQQDGVSMNTNRAYLEAFPVTNPRNAGAVLIFPGGGFRCLATTHEGRDIAHWVNKELSMAAFVVHYQLAHLEYPQPYKDAQRAIRIVRQHANEWQLCGNQIGVMGFSIGGHLAATLAIKPNAFPITNDPFGTVDARPAWCALGYPVTTMNPSLAHIPSTQKLLGKTPDHEQIKQCDLSKQVTDEVCPIFAFHGLQDPAVNSEQTIRFMDGVKPYSPESELHIYQLQKHSFGLATNETGKVHDWPETLHQWLSNHQLVD